MHREACTRVSLPSFAEINQKQNARVQHDTQWIMLDGAPARDVQRRVARWSRPHPIVEVVDRLGIAAGVCWMVRHADVVYCA